MQYCLLILFLFFLNNVSSAFVFLPDSVGIENSGGKKLILHQVEPRETWFSLSRKYGITAKAIQEANPGTKVLQIGENVRIPAARRVVRTSTVLGANYPSPSPVKPAEEVAGKKPVVQETPRVVTPKAKPAPAIEPKAEPQRSENPATHTVAAGETMFGIAKQYGVTVAELKAWNHLTDLAAKKGQVLKLSASIPPEYRPAPDQPEPVVKNNASRSAGAKPNPKTPEEDVYVVNKPSIKPEKKKKHNPYSNDPWERLEALADTVTPGKPKVQPRDTTRKPKILPNGKIALPGTVAGGPAKPGLPGAKGLPAKPVKKDTVAVKPRKVFETPNLEPAPLPPSQAIKAQKDSSANRPLKEVSEQGAASWINDEQVNPNKFYALHRSAPIGTIIKVTNITTHQSVYVKVIGVLPDSGDNTNILIKISRAAAKKLGVSDPKFQAELNYGMPQ